MTKFIAGPSPCLNCNTATKGKYNYKGVVVCSNCFALAKMCDRRAVKQTLQLLEIYRESLRVSLASGKLSPSSELPTGEKVKPPTKVDLKEVAMRLFDWRQRLDRDIEARRAENEEVDQKAEG